MVVREMQDKEYPSASLDKIYGDIPIPPLDLEVDPFLTDTLNMFYSEWMEYMEVEAETPRQ